MKRGVAAVALVAALVYAGGCQDDEASTPITALELGEAAFRDPGFSDSGYNAFSCATCHAERADDLSIHAGYSLVGSAFRASWWGGYEQRLLDAVDFCLVYFMRGRALDEADPRGRALYEYLVQLGPERSSPALPLTIVANVTTVDRGDATRGAEVWQQACAVCHGAPHTGRGRITDLASVVPETSIEFADEIGADPDLVIVEKVRHGQFFGVGGNMPLFSKESLSDEDLAALLGYLAE